MVSTSGIGFSVLGEGVCWTPFWVSGRHSSLVPLTFHLYIPLFESSLRPGVCFRRVAVVVIFVPTPFFRGGGVVVGQVEVTKSCLIRRSSCSSSTNLQLDQGSVRDLKMHQYLLL